MSRPAFSLLIVCLLFSCAQVRNTQHREPLPSSIPVMRILNDTMASAINISSLHIEVEVAANIATTTFDIVFYNPNNRILEGEFEFPLADGQHIVRYALDIEGKLREGVVAEKAKARQAFENTIRRQIDPGLVEKTKGNNFRTRIYPMPANGSRHILIAVEEVLPQESLSQLYQLPLYSKETIADFSIRTIVYKSAVAPEIENSPLQNFRFKRQQEAWVADYTQKNYTASQTIRFSLPRTDTNETIYLTEKYKGRSYFYLNHYMEGQGRTDNPHQQIGIFWDVSASSSKRDLVKEKELLKSYLTALGNPKVSLVPFHVTTQQPQVFDIRNGNSEALMEAIDQLVYDGGTRYGAIDLHSYGFDEALLFTDGLGSFGEKEIVFTEMPVITVNTSPAADYAHLKYIAQQSKGKWIDLAGSTTEAALRVLLEDQLQVVKVDYDPAAIEALVLPVPAVVTKGLSFAGILNVPEAKITVSLGYGNTITDTKTFTLRQKDTTDYDQVKRIWATMRISELELQYEQNKEVITGLGKEFSVVTQNTSLIVLDRVEDYVEQEITPPAALQKEYYVLLAQKKSEEKEGKELALQSALNAMNEMKEWWKRDHKGGKRIKLEPGSEETLMGNTISVTNQEGLAAVDTAAVSYQFSAPVIHNDEDVVAAPPPPMQGIDGIADQKEVTLNATLEAKEEEDRMEYKETASAIELKEWKPDAPYLDEMEKATAATYRDVYLKLKKQYAEQPSFYLDIARFLFQHKEQQLAIQVLSNVAEMKLEEASLLRMMANQLMEAGEKQLAVATYRDILQMREEEPQSYRDLALALNETGAYNEAIQLMYRLLLGNWHDRFTDVKSITLNEMNAIISAHPGQVDLAGIDPRLVFAMPVDVRIVISWNADNSDIDLWVTDPQKEKCFYENTATALGGRISQDVTGGYGPEEFMLKKAIDGKYKVEVNLYGDNRQTLGGPIAIKADLYTDYGKPTQKRETINFRVTTGKEVVELGALSFSGLVARKG
jgi:tetratricopeptide (TPR) repeat protein